MSWIIMALSIDEAAEAKESATVKAVAAASAVIYQEFLSPGPGWRSSLDDVMHFEKKCGGEHYGNPKGDGYVVSAGAAVEGSLWQECDEKREWEGI